MKEMEERGEDEDEDEEDEEDEENKLKTEEKGATRNLTLHLRIFFRGYETNHTNKQKTQSRLLLYNLRFPSPLTILLSSQGVYILQTLFSY